MCFVDSESCKLNMVFLIIAKQYFQFTTLVINYEFDTTDETPSNSIFHPCIVGRCMSIKSANHQCWAHQFFGSYFVIMNNFWHYWYFLIQLILFLFFLRLTLHALPFWLDLLTVLCAIYPSPIATSELVKHQTLLKWHFI